MSAFKLTLKETRVGMAMCETTPRYDVLLNGEKVGQLYYNMTGYTGCYLPIPNSEVKFSVGEGPISKWRKEVASLNREALESQAERKQLERQFVASQARADFYEATPAEVAAG